jgi:predicted nucleotide-binding protein
LDSFWEHYRRENAWPSTRLIHSTTPKQEVYTALSSLGGDIVFETQSGGSPKVFQLTLIGVLLTSNGEKYFRLLARALGHVRDLYLIYPERTSHTDDDFAKNLNLDATELDILGHMLTLSLMGLSAVRQISGRWTMYTNDAVEGFPHRGPVSSYLEELLLKRFSPDRPVYLDDRYRELAAPFKELESALELSQRKTAVVTDSDKLTKVFVVHGRNEKIRAAMFQFLRSIGLAPLEWNEIIKLTQNAAPFIGEMLDVGFKNAQAVVVLLTPDDEAKLRDEFIVPHDPPYERSSAPQARPNVLFEAGLAFGFHPTRTVLVQFGEIRPFSDLAGRHIIRMDGSAAKRHDLAHRLKNAGCLINIDRSDWLSAGDFSING